MSDLLVSIRRAKAGDTAGLSRVFEAAWREAYWGVIPGLARRFDRKIVRFDTAYRDLRGLLVKSREMDALLLCGLPASTWDSTAAAMARSLSDAAITAAIGRMPREYVVRSAPLAATLRARRDRLPDVARRFHARLHAAGRCRMPQAR